MAMFGIPILTELLYLKYKVRIAQKVERAGAVQGLF